MGYDGSINIDTKINTKGFNTGMSKMTSAVKGLGIAIAAAFGIRQVVAFGRTAVAEAAKMADALVGLQSIVEGTGNSFAAAQGFIEEYTADGLIVATDAITAYKNLLSRGYDVDQIEQTLIALKDSAAFGRQGQLQLGEAVARATEGLKNENSTLVDNAGVTKNLSLIWKDYAQSIGTTVGALTKEQKIAAEVAGILEETRFQTGDAAKLADTYSGRLAGLTASFTNLKIAIGNSIIPILNQIIPYLKAAIDAMVIFFNRVAQIVNLLFGTNVSVASSQTADAIDAVGESASGAAQSQDDLAKSTTDAGKAAKGALAGFDRLNVLQQETAGTGAGGDGTDGAGAVGIDPLIADETGGIIDELSGKVAEWKETVLDFFGPAAAAFGNIYTVMKPLAELSWDALTWLWENVLVPLGLWAGGEYLPAFINLLAAALSVLEPVLKALAPIWQWFYENVLVPVATFTGAALIAIMEWLTIQFQKLSEWIEKNNGTFRALIIIVGIAAGILSLLFIPIGGVIVILAALIAIILLLGKHWDWIVARSKDAAEGMKKAFAPVWAWIKDNVVNPIIKLFNWMINSTINILNGLIRAINGISFSVPEWVPQIGGATYSSNIPLIDAVRLPRLATGAVIPPNSEFAAILGDQKSGTNIEAPEKLIRQIINEEMGSMKADISISFEGTLAALIRELKPRIDAESVRVGRSLITGGAA